MKYHRFRLGAVFEVLIVAPRANEFVWLSFYLAPKLRNGTLSLEMIKYILSKLNGVHHIHPLRPVATFKRAARLLGWRNEGASPYFEQCRAYRARSKDYNITATPLLDHLIEHRELRRVTDARTFYSRAELRMALNNIREDFRGLQHGSAAQQQYTADGAARRRR